MPEPESIPAGAGDRIILTVTELTALLKGAIERPFSDVWVEGEISNLRRPTSGHLYFTLKDASSQIRVVVFRALGRLLRFEPEDGLAIILRGHLTVYEPRGEYQIVGEYLEPKGLGALQLAFEQLRERLFREGLFDEERKKPIPFLPRRIAVVTSPTGAVIRDILHVVGRRYPGMPILVVPAPVQGAGAASKIAAAVDLINARRDADVIILARGGGSLEDLRAFNEETVARAIARSKIPVISGVGHETDFTIADFVADLRAPTPSAAAEHAVPVKADLAELARSLRARLHGGMAVTLERHRLRLREVRRALLDPSRAVGASLQRVDDLRERLEMTIGWLFDQSRSRIERPASRIRLVGPRTGIIRARSRAAFAAAMILRRTETRVASARSRAVTAVEKLNALSPLAILARGYCVAAKLPSLAVIKSASDLAPGDRLRLVLSIGRAVCAVERTEEDSASDRRV